MINNELGAETACVLTVTSSNSPPSVFTARTSISPQVYPVLLRQASHSSPRGKARGLWGTPQRASPWRVLTAPLAIRQSEVQLLGHSVDL